MTDQEGDSPLPAFRSPVQDALGFPIPADGDLRVWLDDNLDDRRAPDGWIHLISAREVCFLLLSGRVVELSLDHDLSDDVRFGTGRQVIDFLETEAASGNRLWPRAGIAIHSANAGGRDVMARAIRSQERRGEQVTERLQGGQPRFVLQPVEHIE